MHRHLAAALGDADTAIADTSNPPRLAATANCQSAARRRIAVLTEGESFVRKFVVSTLAVTLVALTMVVAPSHADAAPSQPRIVKIESGSLTVTDAWDDDVPAPPSYPKTAAKSFNDQWWLSHPAPAGSLSVSACAGSVKGTVTITASRSANPKAEYILVNVIATLYRTTAGCLEVAQLNSKSYSAWIEAGQTRNANIKLGAFGTYDRLTVKFTVKNTSLGLAPAP